jgi:electron transport complex protein RnfB
MWTTILTAVITITVIALVAGLLLSFASSRLPADRDPLVDKDRDPLVDKVNKLLPQTQCAQCGYPGCRPYATAIVEENASINLCSPGGDETMQRLADLLGRDPVPLEVTPPAVALALVDEARCIGCTYCREVCP